MHVKEVHHSKHNFTLKCGNADATKGHIWVHPSGKKPFGCSRGAYIRVTFLQKQVLASVQTLKKVHRHPHPYFFKVHTIELAYEDPGNRAMEEAASSGCDYEVMD